MSDIKTFDEWIKREDYGDVEQLRRCWEKATDVAAAVRSESDTAEERAFMLVKALVTAARNGANATNQSDLLMEMAAKEMREYAEEQTAALTARLAAKDEAAETLFKAANRAISAMIHSNCDSRAEDELKEAVAGYKRSLALPGAQAAERGKGDAKDDL